MIDLIDIRSPAVDRISARLRVLQIQTNADDQHALAQTLMAYGASTMIRQGASPADTASVLRRVADAFEAFDGDAA